MKKLYPIFILILLTSCVSNRVGNSIEPLWYSDTFDYLSTSKYLVFKSKGVSIVDAESIISRDTKFLSKYIEPKKEKEYINDNGETYLLYSIEKKDLELVFYNEINLLKKTYTKFENDGDISSGILTKILNYQKALTIYDDVNDIVSFANTLNIILNPDINIEDLKEKLTFTQEQVVFTINVQGDINGAVKGLISSELNNLGYKTSNDGLVIIDTILTLTPAKLNNDYINKFWNLQISIRDIYGTTIQSLRFNGRESQITDEALDQLIIRVASKKIIDSLKEVIP